MKSIRLRTAALSLALAIAPAATSPPIGPFEPEAAEIRSCVVHPDVRAVAAETPPPELVETIEAGLADERLQGAGLGFSLWIEGYGEIASRTADLRLRPASNQKLLTAMAVLEILGPGAMLETKVVTDGLVAGGTLQGNLYLVGGGDPTVASTGSHSLEALAAAVRNAGIRRVNGAIIADESRYDDLRMVSTWNGVPVPAWVGSLSAVMVDENRYRADWPFIAEPAAANAQLFDDTLRAAGVSVTGDATVGTAPSDAATVTRILSPPMRDLTAVMLTDSNNTVAEMLVKAIGHRHRGVGSTASGVAAMADVVKSLCVQRSILQQDGSGLSHGNARSARDWRRLLQQAQTRPWWDDFVAGLAVAGETGTLQRRFVDTAAQDNLRAKTGSINGLRSLSGILTTAGGRRVFFSAIVDADEPRVPMTAIDDLLVAIAESEA